MVNNLPATGILDPSGLLPDFSFAGYNCGERPIPDLPVACDVRRFGAVGDGVNDDTGAFQHALAATAAGAILVPAGRYLIRDMLTIGKPGVVLRGEGGTASVLVFDRHLTDVQPDWGATTEGRRTSNYSWAGGFIRIAGDLRVRPLHDVVEESQRGSDAVQVASTEGLAPGQWVTVQVDYDADGTLASFLYAGDPGNVSLLRDRFVRQPARIVAIDERSGRVRLDRPLRFATRQAWKPRLCAMAPTVTGSGIERLGFEFPALPYRGHFTELGFNAIALDQVAHCWVREVDIRNAESGIFVTAIHCSLADITISGVNPIEDPETHGTPGGCIGHHAIMIGGGGSSDNLVTGFDIQDCYIHDLTVDHSTAGNVFSAGRGRDMSLDHHRAANHANLFTAIACGLGNRPWFCGGGHNLGRQSGAWNTMWNLRAAKPLTPPPPGWGPAAMLVTGLAAPILPENLHAAQLTRRLDQPAT